MPNYLDVPTGGGANTPGIAGYDPGSSTIDVRVQAQANDWDANTGTQRLFDNSDQGNTNGRFAFDTFHFGGQGLLAARWQNPASAYQSETSAGLVGAAGIARNGRIWTRVLMAPAAGTFDFYWSRDGSTWTQIGSQFTGYTTTGVYALPTRPNPAIGQSSAFSSDFFTGKIYTVQVLIGGATVINMDWTTAALGNGPWVATSGETWTRMGTSTVMESVPGVIDYSTNPKLSVLTGERNPV